LLQYKQKATKENGALCRPKRQTRNAEAETPGPGRTHEAKNMPVCGNKLRIDTQSRDSNGAVSAPSASVEVRNGVGMRNVEEAR
jgi:hypothetical protein